MNVSENRTIFVGGTVIAALAVVLMLMSGKNKIESGPAVGSYRIEAAFNRVDGLVVGNEVQLGGVRIGSVVDQKLDAHYRAIVGLSIRDAIKLPKDTSAAIHTDGLFGSKYVILEPGGEEENMAAGGRIDFTQDALIVSELLELIISQGKRNAKEAAEAKAQVKEAAKILGSPGGSAIGGN